MTNSQNELSQIIKNLLNQQAGIDLGTLNGIDLHRILQKKVGSLEIDKLENYYAQLSKQKTVFNELIEEVIVPETSFFRHPASFQYLKSYVLEQQSSKRTFRVLCMPCSTGEEAYSIAITLLEAGLTESQIRIDAFDISHRAIASAQIGRYKKYAFRSAQDLATEYYLDKYFEQEGKYYDIKQKIKELVQFQWGNLVDESFLAHLYSYDIVFCRNVLIYFNTNARQKVITKLHHLLNEKGLLFLGYAETEFVNRDYFRALSIPHTFVYQKQHEQKSCHQDSLKRLSNEPSNNPRLNILDSKLFTITSSHRQTSSITRKYSLKTKKRSSNSINQKKKKGSNILSKNPSTPTSQIEEEGLKQIQSMADQGALEIALQDCHTFLKKYPTTAKGYFLLGCIYQAKNQDIEAKKAFQKSLYLNPSCQESISHLIFLCENSKELEQAERYRQRLHVQESRLDKKE